MLAKISVIAILLFSFIPAFAERSPTERISEFYATDIKAGQIAFMWLGEGKGDWAGAASAGVMIKTSKHTIVIDPSNILDDDIRAIKSLDLILITHEHSDHFNADSTVLIHNQTEASVLVSAGVYPRLQNLIANDKLVEMLPDDVKTVDGITVHAIPAKHPVDRPVMYLINMDGLVVFHGSDSGFVDRLNDINSEVHLAFVPVGGASPTASPDDAASMVRALRPYVTVPVHGSFEQMKALEDIVGNETVLIIPSAYSVKVPDQIVPEFPLGLLIFAIAFFMAIVTLVKIKQLSLQKY